MSNDDKSNGKIKTFLKSRWGELAVLGVLSAFALLFTVIFYSVKFTDYRIAGIERADVSLWTADIFYLENSLFPDVRNITNINTYFIIAFVAVVVLYAIATAVRLFKRFNLLFAFAAVCNAAVALVYAILGVVLGVIRGGAIVCCVITVLFSMATTAFVILRRGALSTVANIGGDGADDGGKSKTIEPGAYKKYRLAVLICECVAIAVTMLAFFIPAYFVKGKSSAGNIPIAALSANAPIAVSVVFIIMFVALFAELFGFIFSVSEYLQAGDRFVKKSRMIMTGAFVFTLIYFAMGFCLAFYFNVEKNAEATNAVYGTVAYIPLLFNTLVLGAYAVFYGRLNGGTAAGEPSRARLKIEPLIFAIAMTIVTFVSLVLDIVDIRVEFKGAVINSASMSGYMLLSDYKTLEGGFQALAFMEAAVLLTSGVLLLISLVSFLTKDNNYYKIIKISAVANFLFVMLIGLFGLYFKIAQKINMENIKSVLSYYNISIPDGEYEYVIKSNTIYMLAAGFAIMVAMFVRGIFGRGEERAAHAVGAENAAASLESSRVVEVAAAQADASVDFDACPAFTDLDGRQAQYQVELDERRRHLFANPTLPNIVRFAVDYARECRLHLSYSAEDMATFVAGLGASRLTILQGMSGTGKTSLPKIFTEAVMGNCEIVEVESSWRDKNELLGYYNEFSKCFTPKKFTQCLYKARLNSSVLTFIVLDEMNLSRIEYYFSDFLSLMENEEKKREIKLSNVKLFRRENGQNVPYDGLIDGYTVKIPANVWFIGTANRDESTFDISDKVYDRAQTMNFNKRAPKIQSFGEPLDKRFVPYDMLLRLFDAAKTDYVFDAENSALIQKTEKLLAPYNISFGNRVLRQIEDFVKIYCACFGDKAAAENAAVERILLSKVVSKLENKVVENKQALASEFDKLGLKSCGEFVRKLSED